MNFSAIISPDLRWIAVIFVIFISISLARASDETNQVNQLTPQALFQTDIVYTQPGGTFQIELAPVFQDGRSSDTWTVPISVTYGITSNLQAVVNWNAFVLNNPDNGPPVSGISDLSVGTQYSFMNVGGSLFHVAPLFSVDFPLGNVNNGISDGFIVYEPAVVVARDFPQLHWMQVFTEVKFNFVQRVKTPDNLSNEQPAAHAINWNAGFFVPFKTTVATMEFSWDNNQWNHHGQINGIYLTPGFTWDPSPNFEIGLGIPVGLNNKSDNFDVMVHFVVDF